MRQPKHKGGEELTTTSCLISILGI